MGAAQKYETGRVGEDLVLQYELTDADIETAVITIQDSTKAALELDGETADIPSARIAQYVWTPTKPGYYFVEWHVQHTGGIDKRSKLIPIIIEAKLQT